MKSIYNEVFQLLNYNVYLNNAPDDAPTPYIVQRLSLEQLEFPFTIGRLEIHIWDKSKSALETLEIRDDVVETLNMTKLSTDDVCFCRLYLFSESFIPDEPGIYHYVLNFDLRAYKSSEAEAILAREGNM